MPLPRAPPSLCCSASPRKPRANNGFPPSPKLIVRCRAFRRTATRLRVDGLKLRQFLELLPQDIRAERDEERRRALGLLHALRLALIQHIFLRTAAIPAFSKRNDVSRDDVMDMVFELRIDEVLVLLRQAFPVDARGTGDFPMAEATDYPEARTGAYEDIHQRFIEPIAQAGGLLTAVTRAVSHHFGAFG